MAIERSRKNPVKAGATPTTGLSQMVGGSAVPSSGLSQYVGGHRRDDEDMEEARLEGGRLIHHLRSLHGGSYASAFAEGMKGGDGTGGSRTGAYEGQGKLSGGASPPIVGGGMMIEEADEEAPLVGGSRCGGDGTGGKKAKRVVGAGDGRRKRGALVSKVMREQGIKSLAEASAYIKKHNLYS